MAGETKRGESPGGRGTASEWFTLGQAATYLGVAQSTVRKWADAERLAVFYTPGGHRRFKRGDLDEFVGTSRGRERPIVLIVDDDAALRASLRASLESDGVEVREAGSAEEGMAALEDEPPSLVLLDVMMPQVDGWEMLRLVRERHGLEAVPVVMFSGSANGADEAERRGAQGFVGKPFDPEKLLASTRQLLRR